MSRLSESRFIARIVCVFGMACVSLSAFGDSSFGATVYRGVYVENEAVETGWKEIIDFEFDDPFIEHSRNPLIIRTISLSADAHRVLFDNTQPAVLYFVPGDMGSATALCNLLAAMKTIAEISDFPRIGVILPDDFLKKAATTWVERNVISEYFSESAASLSTRSIGSPEYRRITFGIIPYVIGFRAEKTIGKQQRIDLAMLEQVIVFEETPGTYVSEYDEMMWHNAAQVIPAGSLVKREMISPRLLVLQNEDIDVYLEKGGLSVVLSGVALSPGRFDQTVPIRIDLTGRRTEGVVFGERSVRVETR